MLFNQLPKCNEVRPIVSTSIKTKGGREGESANELLLPVEIRHLHMSKMMQRWKLRDVCHRHGFESGGRMANLLDNKREKLLS